MREFLFFVLWSSCITNKMGGGGSVLVHHKQVEIRRLEQENAEIRHEYKSIVDDYRLMQREVANVRQEL